MEAARHERRRLLEAFGAGTVQPATQRMLLRREDQLGRQLGKGTLWERVQPENLQKILKVSEDMRKGKL